MSIMQYAGGEMSEIVGKLFDQSNEEVWQDKLEVLSKEKKLGDKYDKISDELSNLYLRISLAHESGEKLKKLKELYGMDEDSGKQFDEMVEFLQTQKKEDKETSHALEGEERKVSEQLDKIDVVHAGVEINLGDYLGEQEMEDPEKLNNFIVELVGQIVSDPDKIASMAMGGRAWNFLEKMINEIPDSFFGTNSENKTNADVVEEIRKQKITDFILKMNRVITHNLGILVEMEELKKNKNKEEIERILIDSLNRFQKTVVAGDRNGNSDINELLGVGSKINFEKDSSKNKSVEDVVGLMIEVSKILMNQLLNIIKQLNMDDLDIDPGEIVRNFEPGWQASISDIMTDTQKYVDQVGNMEY